MNPRSFFSGSRPAPTPDLSRRSFLRTTATGAAFAVTAPLLRTTAAPAPRSETVVKSLYDSLTPEQREAIVKPWNDDLRSEVDNNWHITKPRVGKDFNADQQAMIREIFLGIHNPEYAEKVLGQVAHDSDEKGLEDCSIAIFGEPGQGRFEFVLTGRHVTRRCDGDSLRGTAFGGPLFYGHAARSFNEAPDHPGNIYWYQAVRANQVYQMLDGRQQKLCLLENPRKEEKRKTVAVTGKTEGLPGIPMTELSRDQKDEVRRVVADVLAPFRLEDTYEALRLIEQSGFDNLHMAFYKDGDIGNDGVWDIWQIEGPGMVLFFRGEPHVHAYIHVRDGRA